MNQKGTIESALPESARRGERPFHRELLVQQHPDQQGERIVAHDPLRSGDTEVEVVSPVFYDPSGARLRS